MKTKKLYFVFGIVCLLLCLSCTKDSPVEPISPDPEPEIPHPGENENVKLSDNTVYITPEFIDHVLEPVTGMNITVNSSIEKSKLPKEGKILLYGAISEKFPYGFLGKVSKVDKTEAGIKIETEAVSLEEAFDRLYINEVQTFAFEDFDSQEEQQRISRGGGFALSRYSQDGYNGIQFRCGIDFSAGLDNNWKKKSGNSASSASLSGNIDIGGGIGFKLACNIDIDKAKNKKPWAAITLNSYNFFEYKSNLKGSLNQMYERDLKKLPVVAPMLYPQGAIIQLVFRLEIILSAFVGINGELEANQEMHAQKEWMLFFEHKNGNTASGVSELHTNGKSNVITQSFALKGTVSAGLGLAFSTKLFNSESVSARASINVGPSITAELPISNGYESYYDSFKDSKVIITPFNFNGQVEVNTPFFVKEHGGPYELDLFNVPILQKEYFLFPSFENMKVSARDNLAAVTSDVKRDLLLPVNLSYGLFDGNKNYIKQSEEQITAYKEEKEQTAPMSAVFENLDRNQKYYVRPIVELPVFGKIKALPEEEIKPIEITTGTANVIDKSNVILYGWINNIGDIGLAQYGICCSTNSDFSEQTVIKANNIDNVGLYSISLSGLQPGIHYYKAYMVIGDKNYYGELKAFTIEKEGDSDVTETGLVGTWESTYMKGWYKNSEQPELNEVFDEPTTGHYLRQVTFKANGTGDEKGNPFTWTLKGNTTLIATDGEDEVLIAGEILNLTDKELIVGEPVYEGTETSYLETTYKRIK